MTGVNMLVFYLSLLTTSVKELAQERSDRIKVTTNNAGQNITTSEVNYTSLVTNVKPNEPNKSFEASKSQKSAIHHVSKNVHDFNQQTKENLKISNVYSS